MIGELFFSGRQRVRGFMILLSSEDLWSCLIEWMCDLAWLRAFAILLGSEDCDLDWFRGLKSCLIQRIMILLGSEDYDLAWWTGLMIFWGRVDLWSCLVVEIMILCGSFVFMTTETFMILRREEVLLILCGWFMILYVVPLRIFMILLGRG